MAAAPTYTPEAQLANFCELLAPEKRAGCTTLDPTTGRNVYGVSPTQTQTFLSTEGAAALWADVLAANGGETMAACQAIYAPGRLRFGDLTTRMLTRFEEFGCFKACRPAAFGRRGGFKTLAECEGSSDCREVRYVCTDEGVAAGGAQRFRVAQTEEQRTYGKADPAELRCYGCESGLCVFKAQGDGEFTVKGCGGECDLFVCSKETTPEGEQTFQVASTESERAIGVKDTSGLKCYECQPGVCIFRPMGDGTYTNKNCGGDCALYVCTPDVDADGNQVTKLATTTEEIARAKPDAASLRCYSCVDHTCTYVPDGTGQYTAKNCGDACFAKNSYYCDGEGNVVRCPPGDPCTSVVGFATPEDALCFDCATPLVEGRARLLAEPEEESAELGPSWAKRNWWVILLVVLAVVGLGVLGVAFGRRRRGAALVNVRL